MSLFDEFSGRVRVAERGCSSAGRAPALQAGGQRFEPAHLHQHIENRIDDIERSSVFKAAQRALLAESEVWILSPNTVFSDTKSGYRWTSY